jgi:hypothetical protein
MVLQKAYTSGRVPLSQARGRWWMKTSPQGLRPTRRRLHHQHRNQDAGAKPVVVGDGGEGDSGSVAEVIGPADLFVLTKSARDTAEPTLTTRKPRRSRKSTSDQG